MTVMMERVPGIRSAPPTPCTRAERDQLPGALGEPAGQRGEREDGESAQEHLLAAVAVAEDAAREQQRREREHVAVHDPLQLGDPGIEGAADAGQGHVDHGVVEHHHGQREAHGEQHDDLLACVVPFEPEHRHSFRCRPQGRCGGPLEPANRPYGVCVPDPAESPSLSRACGRAGSRAVRRSRAAAGSMQRTSTGAPRTCRPAASSGGRGCPPGRSRGTERGCTRS